MAKAPYNLNVSMLEKKHGGKGQIFVIYMLLLTYRKQDVKYSSICLLVQIYLKTCPVVAQILADSTTFLKEAKRSIHCKGFY